MRGHWMGGMVRRRAAERFAMLLERPDRIRSADDEVTAMLARASALRNLPLDGDLDAATRLRLRQRLVAVATVRPVAEEDSPATAPPPEPGRTRLPWWRRHAILAGTAAVAVLVASGAGVASTDATPGSPLYGLKRATESAQLAASRSATGRGRLQLDFARIRLAEAGASAGGDAAAALRTMDQQTVQGVRLLDTAAVARRDDGPLDSIDGFLSRQRPQLLTLLSREHVAQTRALARAALALLDRIRIRVDGLRASLRCAASAGVRRTDDLGPLPQPCAAPGGATGPGPQLPGVPSPRGDSPSPFPSGDASGSPAPGGGPVPTPSPSAPGGSLSPTPLPTPSPPADSLSPTPLPSPSAGSLSPSPLPSPSPADNLSPSPLPSPSPADSVSPTPLAAPSPPGDGLPPTPDPTPSPAALSVRAHQGR